MRASTKYAGGIAGVNDAGGMISACFHAQNQVYATNGEVGGIAGNNNSGASIENAGPRRRHRGQRHGGRRHGHELRHHRPRQRAGKNSSVSSCTITGTSESIGTIAAYNRAGATIRNVKLAENAKVQFSTPAVTIGGLAGMNEAPSPAVKSKTARWR